ncbi:MAG: germination lipoprotein GerS-related protein [Clostridiaceae bacterium]|nr:germination lipoprotein GerS-related protein [Clostridiaceae bacterium]
MKIEAKSLKKWLFLLLLIPFISIILVIIFRNNYFPTNEEIIDKVKNTEAYTSNVQYIIKNSKGKYEENTKIYFSKKYGMRIEFENDRTKIYKEGSISMKDKGSEYETNGDIDQLYPLAFTSNLLSNSIQEIKEGAEEWGDAKYIEIKVDLPYKNIHMTSAKLYINKNDNTPIVAKIFDINGDERVTILYKDFEYMKKIDESLF